MAAEVLGQDGFDFGHLVEFADEFDGGETVVERAVDAFAQGTGEAGDFAGAIGGGIKIYIEERVLVVVTAVV